MSKSRINRKNSNTPSLGKLYRERSRYVHLVDEIVPAGKHKVKGKDGVEHTITVPAHTKRVGGTYRKPIAA